MTNVISFASLRSRKLIDEGLKFFSDGEITEAVRCFKSSLDLVESAEGYTYLGWMLSFSGQLEAAIELCKKAISLDPDYGNPYNDIGTYYMKQGALADAIPWLEKAKKAKNYEAKQYPYLNLGRIYLSQGMFKKALKEFEVALELDPENSELRSVVARIRTRESGKKRRTKTPQPQP